MDSPEELSARTYLRVPYAEKDQAKALGARWDPSERSWYVPPGISLDEFTHWLPTVDLVLGRNSNVPATGLDPVSQTTNRSGDTRDAVAQVKGISLAQLLRGVERIISSSFNQEIWIRVEVLRITVGGSGHLFLELTERDSQGCVLAKAPGTVWTNVAQQIVPEFERVTGAQLAAGIRLLILAKPVFKAQYGFSLNITAIDPSYTLGQLEAHKRQIRQALQKEGLFKRNRQLPPPWIFSRVLVLAPNRAASLGDFHVEATRLQQAGVCEFVYLYSRFQGEGAATEMLHTLQAALTDHLRSGFDAVVIIRGGGAVNDLAWLNDLVLARFICECPVPVLTGIGHERDSTVLDEVAHQSFDTPSKVIAGIEQQIVQRAREAQAYFDDFFAHAIRLVRHAHEQTRDVHVQVFGLIHQSTGTANDSSEMLVRTVRDAAQRSVHDARLKSRVAATEVRSDVTRHMHLAMQDVPKIMEYIKNAARGSIRGTERELDHVRLDTLRQAGHQLRQAKQQIQGAQEGFAERTAQALQRARMQTDALMREVAGQGPDKTIARGFALVRGEQGRPIMSAKAAAAAGVLKLQFSDGAVDAHSENTIHQYPYTFDYLQAGSSK